MTPLIPISPAFALSPASPWPSPRRPRPARCPSRPYPLTITTITSSASNPPTATTPLLDPSLRPALSHRHILLTGGTGLIGRALIHQLRLLDAQITLLARHPPSAKALFHHPSHPPLTILRYDAQTPTLSPAARAAIASADVLINLAGEPVDQPRWTHARKRVLWNSRVCGTQKLVDALAGAHAVLVSASAVGYYGTSETKLFVEDSAPGHDFLATLASAWEQAALRNTCNSRTVVLRMGVVLANGGGALQKMSAAFRAFLGGPPGGGKQWFSWVHIDDLCRLILHAAADDKWTGVYNATAPQPVRLQTFCIELGRVLGRPSWLPVPKNAVKALMGSEAAELILKGQHVVSTRVSENGFVYRYKDVGSALQQLTRVKSAVSEIS